MDNRKGNKATPTKDAGAKDESSGSASNYKYSPRVETPDPKAAKNKAPSSGNIRGV